MAQWKIKRSLQNYYRQSDSRRFVLSTTLAIEQLQNKFPYVNGETATMDWLRMTGLREPFIVEDSEGLDMQMPRGNLTVNDVADMCGRDRIVEVMDVATQSEKQMTLDEWANYFTTPDDRKKRILNVISLEISGSELGNLVTRPKIVRDLDWIDNVWPPRTETPEYPQVQLYCLMSVKDCFTDFHIDFGGSSVFYHLLSGEKIFYFIRPTAVNLKKYEKWSSSPDQNRIFLADEVKECVEVRLTAGNTMIIPTGWIHSVYTPTDSIVIGGNFLHGLNIGGQLDIYRIENKTGVPLKFRFPYFVRMQWFAAKKYLILLRAGNALSKWELEGLISLVSFLQEELNTMNETTQSAERKLARMNVPKAFKNPQKLVQSLGQAMLTNQLSEVTSNLALAELWGQLGLAKKSKKRKAEEVSELVDDWNEDDDGGMSLDPADEDWTGSNNEEEGLHDSEGESSHNSQISEQDDEESEVEESRSRRRRERPKKRFKLPGDFVDDPNDPDFEETYNPKLTVEAAPIVQPIFEKQLPVKPLLAQPPRILLPGKQNVNSANSLLAAKKKMNVFSRLNRAMDKLKRNK
ncbi:JmjC domain-containing histone demethylation protein 1 [Dinochytrium kinnereticum]|nr:JmjC domain-containing histone demethylation protein 1 [Dinochytrium kinnereticum]